eukprot:Lithocolla_globosa_v1_NODE_6264_length_1114_cov_34.528801.p2 type:complete len:155 gc:universal NODE_6264_length_1114_cov_34.528801:287-751(+)
MRSGWLCTISRYPLQTKKLINRLRVWTSTWKNAKTTPIRRIFQTRLSRQSRLSGLIKAFYLVTNEATNTNSKPPPCIFMIVWVQSPKRGMFQPMPIFFTHASEQSPWWRSLSQSTILLFACWMLEARNLNKENGFIYLTAWMECSLWPPSPSTM